MYRLYVYTYEIHIKCIDGLYVSICGSHVKCVSEYEIHVKCIDVLYVSICKYMWDTHQVYPLHATNVTK